ncbi:MAG: hypothetical protein COV67_01520 [Nitrospinae bacterium CG11_big_fil_rev_8_21_14_0_20_56_8]|nr:MAG: hypothetical protein COV67_01520 [Nitrospinae bacterium CG11_big_fil_rev_8_21_14_0_20_56_8]
MKKTFNKSEIIFKEGSRGNCAYIIDSGRVAISALGPSGENRILATLGKNEVFGEMGIIDNQPRTATAVAMENCLLTVIRKKTIDYLLDVDPQSLKPVLKVLSQRLRETTRLLDPL